MNQQKVSSYERHGLIIAQGVILALLIWFGNKTVETSDTVIRVETVMELYYKELVALRSDVERIQSNRYTELDAAKDKRVDDLKHQMRDARSQEMLERIKDIEQYLKQENGWTPNHNHE